MKKKNSPKEIPADILELMESEDTALLISEICLLNGIEKGEEIEKVAYQVARVLLYQSPPELLAEELEKREVFPPTTAYKIAKMVDQRIFSQARESLAELYKEEAGAPKAPLPRREDTYREPIK